MALNTVTNTNAMNDAFPPSRILHFILFIGSLSRLNNSLDKIEPSSNNGWTNRDWTIDQNIRKVIYRAMIEALVVVYM